MSPPVAGIIVVEFVAAGISAALAIVLIRIGPGRPLNQNLALVLGIEAVAGFAMGATWIFDAGFLSVDGGLGEGFYIVFFAGAVVLPWYYLRFLSFLETPLVAWLRSPRARLFIMTASTMGLVILSSMVLVFGFGLEIPIPFELILATVAFFLIPWLVVPVYAIIASVSALRRTARGSLARSRARWTAVAFGLRDVLLGVGGVLMAFSALGILNTRLMPGTIGDIIPLTNLLYVPILGFGIVKSQLFDIEIHVRRGINASLLAFIFLSLLFIVTYVVEEFVERQVGIAFGLAVAGAITFLLRPLERFTRRIAHRLVPAPESSKAVEERKREVYRLAIEDVLRDGRIDSRERESLTNLGARLGLTPRAMADLEDSLAEASRGSAPASPTRRASA